MEIQGGPKSGGLPSSISVGLHLPVCRLGSCWTHKRPGGLFPPVGHVRLFPDSHLSLDRLSIRHLKCPLCGAALEDKPKDTTDPERGRVGSGGWMATYTHISQCPKLASGCNSRYWLCLRSPAQPRARKGPLLSFGFCPSGQTRVGGNALRPSIQQGRLGTAGLLEGSLHTLDQHSPEPCPATPLALLPSRKLLGLIGDGVGIVLQSCTLFVHMLFSLGCGVLELLSSCVETELTE